MIAEPTIRLLLEFKLGLDAATCDEAIEESWGQAFLTPSLPRVWDASYLAIQTPGIEMQEIAILADRVLGSAGFSHRTILVCDEADGRRLAREARALPDWEIEPIEYMSWRTDSGRLPLAPACRVTLDEIAPLRRNLIRESLPPGMEHIEETTEELLELDRRINAATNDCWFVAEAGGVASSACHLLSVDGIGQIDDVGTLESARKKGLAQATVLEALVESRAAENRVTFLPAAADDWPREFYARLGFTRVGEVPVLRRRPETPYLP